jgi:S-adenosylmethionine:diacylglycerol 3-amino-3-carboxypropyl transferase
VIDGYRWRPLYSADNEDTRSELTALEITGDDTVIAVAAGGGRALSLLTASPKRLIAIDKRLDQVFQLELKAAAMGTLEYDDYLGFLGIGDAPDRLDRYSMVRQSLSRSARKYWDRRRRLIQAGAYYAGRTDQALIRFMKALRRLGLMDWAEPFFRATDLEEQRALLDARRATVERGLFWWRLFCHPLVVYAMAQDPSFLRSTEGSVGSYLVRRIIQYAEHNLVRESFLLRLAWDGRLTPTSPLPPYLTHEGFDLARKNLSKLEVQTGDLRDFAVRGRPDGALKWSLSDVSCWMTENGFADLLRAIAHYGSDQSSFCARHFAVRREVPTEVADRRSRLVDATALDFRDSSVIYRFAISGLQHRTR